MDNKLKVFLSVAERENFSRAAEDLHMSQPAVSQQIQSLENELGVKLLERSTKRVSLTRAGKIVMHYGNEIETTFAAMQRTLEELTGITAGPLVIGTSYTVGEYVLPYAVAEFCRQYPDVRPSIQVSNTRHVAQMIVDDVVDIGIVEGNVDTKNLTEVELMHDRMVIIASPSHPTVSDSARITDPETTWILREEGSGTRAAADRVLESIGIQVKSKMEFSSTQAIKTSVQAGLGISIISELAIQQELERKTLVVIEHEAGLSVRPFFLLQRDSAFVPRVAEEFKEFLLQYMKVHYPR